MGKYMKKAKSLGGEVAVVMEIPHQTSLGVRTRARTLALQQQQRRPPAAAAAAVPEDNNNNNAASYLQLRSRRLQKPQISKPKVLSCNQTSPRSGRGRSRVVEPVNSGSVVGSVSVCCSRKVEAATSSYGSPEIEFSFGENVLDVETKGRSTRETTPCSLMRDSENIGSPGSTTRPTTSTNRRIQNSVRQDIPTTQEIEEFFSEAEQMQQKKFIEKYNFDPVNEQPLPGRYEWVKSDD